MNVRAVVFVVGAVGAVVALAAVNVALERVFADNRPEPQPGPWLQEYAKDWLEAHPGQRGVTSGFALGAKSKKPIWATNTPEWDRGWFDKRGWRYPHKWVVYDDLQVFAAPSDKPIELEGL